MTTSEPDELADRVQCDARNLDALADALEANGTPASMVRDEADAAWKIWDRLRGGR